MFRTSVCVFCLLMMCCVLPISAQQPAVAANGVVPPMVKFSGVLTDVNSKPLTGMVGVTFSLYKDSDGGAPLWVETQNVQADKSGHYSVMLGSTSSQGLPGNLFVSGEARWLGVQTQGQSEQPRTLLMSVPYALKAADAETLGGKPLSAFQLAVPQANNSSAQKAQPAAEQPNEIRCAGSAACKTSFIPVFSTNGGSAKVNNSIISQSGKTIAIAGSEAVTSSANDPALLGQSTGTSGASIGVEGQTNSPSSYAVAGFNGGGGWGVYGLASGTSGTSIGVEGVTNSATAYGVAGSNGGNGVGVFGVSVTGHGVYGSTGGAGSYGVVGVNSAAGGSGVFGTAPNGNGFSTDSNVQQARTMGGWVKAMVYYDGADDLIVRCFNSTFAGAAATTPPCGFTTDKTGAGDYIIVFGFQVNDRFFTVSGTSPLVGLGPFYPASWFYSSCTNLTYWGCPHTVDQNSAEFTVGSFNDKSFYDSGLYVIVY
jgi:hypothetical protein